VSFGSGDYAQGNVTLNQSRAAFTADDTIYLPVNLPNGAIVTELLSQGLGRPGGAGSSSLYVRLYRSPIAENISQLMAQTVHEGSTSDQKTDTTIDYATIDNTQYLYTVTAQLEYHNGYDAQLYGIRIKYTITKPLP
jgi:hypothetical protein